MKTFCGIILSVLLPTLTFGQAARYIENGVLKNDLDANNKKILNLDTSNLAIGGGLPTQTGHAGQYLITNGTIASWAAISATVAWDDITGKPSTFPPSTHTHTFASLTSKPTTIAGYGIADAFTQAAADLLYSPLGHVHAYSSLTGLPTLGTAAALNVAASGDAASGEVMKGNDSRNTNTRTPTAHHTTHSTGGTDAIAPADIGAQVAGSYVNANGAITGATKTKITYDAKGLVTSGADATTADIADFTNKRYVTDAQQTVIGNTSGTNTGDNAVNTLYSGLVSNATHTGDVTGATALTLATAQPAVHTWALAQTFTVAPVFTDQPGTRTALGLGTLATQSGTFSGTSSGTNTGDQTSVSGNAGTATTLATGRTIGITGDVTWTSPTFNGSGNVTAAGTASTPIKTGAIGVSIDGAGSVITTGVKGYFTVPYTGTITGWSITANGSSPTCTFDVWKISTGTALPTVSNTIMGTKPALASGNAIRSTTMTGWTTTAFTVGDIFGYNVDAVTVATQMRFTLETSK